MPLTQEQDAVVDAACGRARSVASTIVVEAGAGTGKTSTMVGVAKAKGRQRGLLTVFNRMMAEETKPRLVGTGCRSATLHSVAWSSEAAEPFRAGRGARLSQMLPARHAAESVGIFGDVVISGEVGPTSRNAVGYIVKDWVSRFCQSADPELSVKHFPAGTLREFLPADMSKRAEESPDWFKMVARAYAQNLLPHAKKLWGMMSSPTGDFPSSHDVYLKLYVMSQPRIDYDYVGLDEAQDANPIMLEFMRMAAQQGAQTLYVGDSHQQMYSWRGAVDALSQIQADARLRLSHSFRFGPDVAQVANTVLGSLLYSDFRLVGAGRPSRVVDLMPSADAVICRTNACAIDMALAMREDGGRAGLCMDPSELVREVDTLERFKKTGRSEARRFLQFTSYEEVQEAVENGDAPDLKVLLDLIDKHDFDGTRQILSEIAVGKTPERIAASGADTIYLTAHASKGLEFPKVKLGEDFKGLEKLFELSDAKRREEYNILYVAATRAQSELCLGDSDAAKDLRQVMQAEAATDAAVAAQKNSVGHDPIAA